MKKRTFQSDRRLRRMFSRFRAEPEEDPAEELRDRLLVGVFFGAALGVVFFGIICVVYLLTYLGGGSRAVEEQRISLGGAAVVLLIYPVAGVLAAVLLPLARHLLGSIVVATIAVLPFGMGAALVEGGVNRYGHSSWALSLEVSLFFGVALGTMAWLKRSH